MRRHQVTAPLQPAAAAAERGDDGSIMTPTPRNAAPGPDAPRVFAALLACFALLVAFGSHFPLYRFLYEHLPLFNKFRIPVMIVLLLQVAVALGAAWGWTAAASGWRPRSASPSGGAARVGPPCKPATSNCSIESATFFCHCARR